MTMAVIPMYIYLSLFDLMVLTDCERSCMFNMFINVFEKWDDIIIVLLHAN